MRKVSNLRLVVLPVILLLALAIVATTLVIRKDDTAEARKTITSSAAETGARPRGSATTSAAHIELAGLIDHAINSSELASARWGVCVISMADGLVIFQRNADKLFTPASNMKIYTTGVALDLLGADYRWRTSVYASAQPDSNGRIQGDLILYGRGAPDLVFRSKDDNTGSLVKLADNLYQRGLRRVVGNVIGDESYFRGDPLGDGWQWTDLQWYFGAEASALSINGNEIDVNLVPSTRTDEPPIVRTSDSQGYAAVQNRMTTGKQLGRSTIGVQRGLSDNNIQVWGEFAPGAKGFGARLSVHDPALWAAKLFLDALTSRGITVEGQVLARDSRVPKTQRFDPSQAMELAYVTSQPLGEIAEKTNKESINLYAELILRTLGRERGGIVRLPEPVGRERGDDEAGLSVIRLWLTRAGISTERVALHDGSGLSRLDLVTPESTARLLVSLSKTASSQVFKQSLPISGRDGTLVGRLKPLVDRVSAKTGTLTYDNSLSGYLTTSKGEVLAFSILCNDQTSDGDSTKLIDQIVTLLSAFPDNPSDNAKKSQ